MTYRYDRKEIDDDIFSFVYGCALQDATLQQAFRGKKKWIEECVQAKSAVRQYIDRVMTDTFRCQKQHDEVFLDTVNTVCYAVNTDNKEKAVFSFGNAQKLLNMTAKYCYIACFHDSERRECFRYCHCPMDGIVLEKVWRLSEKLFDKKSQRREKLGTYDIFCKPWSTEGISDDTQPSLEDFPKRYKTFQETVKALIGEEDLFPVEWDYREWKSPSTSDKSND